MSISPPPAAPESRWVFRFSLVLFVLASLYLAWPWLSGQVTIPWDSKAHFQPQLAFLAHALHSGQSPFWTPNVFAGMPQIADPQSLIFSPPYSAAGRARPRAELPAGRRGRLRHADARRARLDALFPRSRLARGGRAGGGAGFRLWRLGGLAASSTPGRFSACRGFRWPSGRSIARSIAPRSCGARWRGCSPPSWCSAATRSPGSSS